MNRAGFEQILKKHFASISKASLIQWIRENHLLGVGDLLEMCEVERQSRSQAALRKMDEAHKCMVSAIGRSHEAWMKASKQWDKASRSFDHAQAWCDKQEAWVKSEWPG